MPERCITEEPEGTATSIGQQRMCEALGSVMKPWNSRHMVTTRRQYSLAGDQSFCREVVRTPHGNFSGIPHVSGQPGIPFIADNWEKRWRAGNSRGPRSNGTFVKFESESASRSYGGAAVPHGGRDGAPGSQRDGMLWAAESV